MVETQKHMGRHQLVERLTAQVGDKEKALGILRGYGYIDAEGKLTQKGKERDAMTAEERAKDRESRRTGKSPKKFKYNPKTNRATMRKS